MASKCEHLCVKRPSGLTDNCVLSGQKYFNDSVAVKGGSQKTAEVLDLHSFTTYIVVVGHGVEIILRNFVKATYLK